MKKILGIVAGVVGIISVMLIVAIIFYFLKKK